jgi:hypothetical protein
MDLTQARENILSIWDQAQLFDKANGFNWYPSAYQTAERIALEGKVSTEQAAGIIAALSPQMEWNKNVELAETSIKRKRFGGHYTSSVNKAKAIFRGVRPESVLKSPDGHDKTFHFYQCIVSKGEMDSVCLDRHALAIALGRETTKEERHALRRKVYRDLAEIYRNLAGELGIKPSELQAVSWVTWKRLKEEETSFDIQNLH